MNAKGRLGRTKAILPLAAVFLLAANISEAKYSGGTGEPNNPYRIETPNDLNDIGNHPNDWDKHFVMVNDINLADYTGTEFNIIGTTWGSEFTGVFDGNDHEISNFSYGPSATDTYIGIFGMVNGLNAQIRKLGLRDPNINVAKTNVGSLVGRLIRGTISDCYVEGGSVVSTGDFVGGLVGDSGFWGATISGCHSSTSVSGMWAVGGLVGYNDGTVSNCYATATVIGDNEVGGLVGRNDQDNGTVSKCAASSTVQGATDVGGLVGSNNAGAIFESYADGSVVGTNSSVGGFVGSNGGFPGGNQATISDCYSTAAVGGNAVFVGGFAGSALFSTTSNCYSTGSVSGEDILGGFLGLNQGTVSDCFWDENASGLSSGVGSGSSSGIVGRTTPQMQTESTFTSAGWDFTTPVWQICEDEDYPRLWWSKYGEGYGTASDPYLIRSACEMQLIGADSSDWHKHFRLTADIDLGAYTATAFNVIGNATTKFTGVFDGNGRTISNFNYQSTGVHYKSLFGYIDGQDTEIRNLVLVDPNVSTGTGDGAASLVNRMTNGTVTGCHVTGGTISGHLAVGGLVGLNETGTVSDCSFAGTVCGEGSNGGLMGSNRGTVTECFTDCNVSGAGYSTGGLIGYNQGAVSYCYSSGSVSGYYYVGGLAGDSRGEISDCYSCSSVLTDGSCLGGLVGLNIDCAILNCYSTGSLTMTGGGYVGGLVGYVISGTTTSSFWDVNSSGYSTSAGGTGMTTTQMYSESTFSSAGWDFTTPIWKICDGEDYPHLWWFKYGAGSGTADDPYLICAAEQMQRIGAEVEDWDKHFKLTADIDLGAYTGTAFNVIGNTASKFTGVFEGNGRTISNFNYQSTGIHYTSLFGYVHGENAEIKNLTVLDANINTGTGYCAAALANRLTEGKLTGCNVSGGTVVGNHPVAGLVGYNTGTISDCNVTGTTIVGDEFVGALVGDNAGTVVNCSSSCSVTGISLAGGIVGYNRSGTISNCHSSSNVSASIDYAGGLAGANIGLISDCCAAGSVDGNTCTGGLVGHHGESVISTSCSTASVVADGNNTGGLVGFIYLGAINRCHASGSVTGYLDFVGGLVGANNMGTISSCYYSGTTVGAGDYVGGLVGYNVGDMSGCYSTGQVTGGRALGGLVGGHELYELADCWSSSAVEGHSYVGGLAGGNVYFGSIYNCYSAGNVVASNGYAGAFAGYTDTASFDSCFWNTTVNPSLPGIGNATDANVIGKSTSEMQTRNTFTDVGWDFVAETVNGPNDIWRMCVDGVSYPLLWWQFTSGDFLCPDGVDFVDYSFFAGHWSDGNCGLSDDCDGVDLDFSDAVDWKDLKIFCQHWLEGAGL